MLKKGMLVLCKSPYRNQFKIKEFSISVVLDADIGNNSCHIRDIYRFDKGELHKTMNWSNLNKELIEGVIMDISYIDYEADFINISDHLGDIKEYLIETIPEYMI